MPSLKRERWRQKLTRPDGEIRAQAFQPLSAFVRFFEKSLAAQALLAWLVKFRKRANAGPFTNNRPLDRPLNLSQATCRSPPVRVARMARIERPTIDADVRPVPALLDEPLRRVVTPLAQALKWPQPEPICVAMVRLNVIADCRGRDDATFEAVLAQGMLEQLVPSNSSPAWRAVPLIPRRSLTAVGHGSTLH